MNTRARMLMYRDKIGKFREARQLAKEKPEVYSLHTQIVKLNPITKAFIWRLDIKGTNKSDLLCSGVTFFEVT